MENKTSWFDYYLGSFLGLLIFNVIMLFIVAAVDSDKLSDIYMWSCCWEVGIILISTPILSSIYFGPRLKSWKILVGLVANSINISAGISYILVMGEKWNRQYTLELPQLVMQTTILPTSVFKHRTDSIILYPMWSIILISVAVLFTIGIFIYKKNTHPPVEETNSEHFYINIGIAGFVSIFFLPSVISNLTFEHCVGFIIGCAYLVSLVWLPRLAMQSFMDEKMTTGSALINGFVLAALGTTLMMINVNINTYFLWDLPTVGFLSGDIGTGAGGGLVYDGVSRVIVLILFLVPFFGKIASEANTRSNS